LIDYVGVVIAVVVVVRIKGEEGLISNTGILKTGISKAFLSQKWERRLSRRKATAISKIISKTGPTKSVRNWFAVTKIG
jgi:hypothetical protein